MRASSREPQPDLRRKLEPHCAAWMTNRSQLPPGRTAYPHENTRMKAGRQSVQLIVMHHKIRNTYSQSVDSRSQVFRRLLRNQLQVGEAYSDDLCWSSEIADRIMITQKKGSWLRLYESLRLVAGVRYVPNLDTLWIPFRSELIQCGA